jgi:hypothetical protein
MAPGTYTITRSALPFLDDHGDSITVTSALSDTNNTSLKSAIGGLKAQYVGIRNFLGSASGSGMTVAVSPGANESWYTLRGGFTGYSNIQAQLNAAGNTLTVTARNSSNQNVSTTLPISGTGSRVSVLASDGGAKLLQIRGGASDLGFKTTTSSSSSSSSSSSLAAEGEGSASIPATLSSSLSNNISSSMSGLSGEGEAAPAPLSFNGSAGALTPSQALRSLLGSTATPTSTTTSSLVSATTHLPPGAVDRALSEFDTLSLGSSELDSLTASNSDGFDHIDSALMTL